MTAFELKPGNPANLSLVLVLVTLFLLLAIPSKSQIPPIETGACSRRFLNFDAADQYLSVSNSPLNGTAGTFEGWIQRDDWSAHADNIIFSNGIEYYTDHSLYLSLHPVGLHFRYGSISPGQGTAAYHIVTTTLTDGTWHHVAASWSHVSGTTTINVFLDGDLIATSNVPYLIDPGANLFFGRNNEAQNFGNGAMAEFRLWNFAKNSSEIIEDMNSTLTGNETGLVGYWPMNESGETVAANLVAGGSDATFVHPTVQLEWQQVYPFTLSADGETYSSGTTHDFGMTGLGQSSDHIVLTIKNVSATAIDLPDDLLTGVDADQFTIDLTTMPDVLAPGASSNFKIAFTPTSLGTKSAAISMVTVDGCEDFFTLNLTASATPALTYSGPGFTETSANNGEVEGYITVAVNGDTFLDDGDHLLTIGSDVIIENIPAGLTPVLTLNSPTEATLTLTGNADNHQHTDNESSIGFDFNETAFSNGSAIALSASSLGIAFTNNPIITFFGDGFTETSDNTGAVEGSIVIALSGDNFLDDGGLLELGTQVTVNNVPDGLTPVLNVVVNAPPASIWQVDQPDGDAWRSVAYGDGKFVAVSYQGDVLVMTASETNTTYDLIDLPSNTWNSVTYGNGLFVAVSYDGNVMTSADGIGWTSHTATASSGWRSVTYGNGLFVAVASTGTNRVMTSEDGITWTPSSAAEANYWTSVIYGEGVFVAVANDGDNRVMTSPDGINWTSREASEASQWQDVTYGDGKFVAVSYDGTNRVMTSDDGISWVAQSTPIGNYTAVAYGGGTFVAVAASGSSSAIISADGENWTAVETNTFDWQGLAYGDEYFFAVGEGPITGHVMTSSVIARAFAMLSLTGNASHHQVTDNVNSVSFEFTDLAFAENIATDVLNATGASASGPGVSFNDNPAIAYSGAGFQETNANDGSVTGSVIIELTGDSFQDDDEDGLLDVGTEVMINNIPDGLTPVFSITDNVTPGKNWTTTTATGNSWYSVTYGNGLFVATGANNRVITSPDGITWTSRTITEANTWGSVTFGDGLFVAVSSNGAHRIMTSPDGINWTARMAPEANAWRSVTYGNGQFVAIAYSTNHIMTSNDGINWTIRTIPESNAWTSVTYGNGQFVVISDANKFMTSPDGITWTVRVVPYSSWYGLTYGEGLYVATANNSTNGIITSPDGITWTLRTAPEQNAWFSVTYANGLFVAAAASGSNRIMTSPDGITWTPRSEATANEWQSITYGAGKFLAVGSSNPFVVTSSAFGSAEAEITFTGKATSHAPSNDVAAITIEFTDAAFGSSEAAQVLNATGPASTGKGINFGDAQTLTFDELPIKTYGDETFDISATSSSGLPVSYTSSNENVATIEGNMVTIVGAGSATIIAMQEGNEDFIGAEPVDQVLTVNKANQTINFSSLAERAFEEEGDFELTATATSALSITYSISNENIAEISGSTVFLVGAGTVTITASQEGNENYFAAEDVSQELIIHKGDQTITFEALPEKTFGDDDFELQGTVFSDARTVTYTSSDENVATIAGNIVTIVGAGSTIITASQSGNDDFNPADDVEQVLIINKADQTITFHELQAKAFGDADFSLTAEGGASGNAIAFTSSDESVATISGSTVTIVGAGTTTITASQPGNNNYNAAQNVEQALTINKADQIIAFSTLSARTFGDADFSLTAEGGASGNTIVFTSSDESVATISGSMVTIVGAGTTTITASQPGNNNYNAAENVEQTLTVNKADQIITFSTLSARTFGDADFSLTAEGGASGNTIVFTSSDESVATISGSTVTIVGAGTTTITASQPGNDNYNATENVEQALTINKADQIIAFSTLSARTFGDADFSLTAEGGASGNTIVFTSSDESVATISGSTVTIAGAGTTTITASQPGNNNYNAAEDVSTTLTIEKASQQITFNSIGTKVFGDLPFDLGATAASGLPVSYESSNSAIVSIAGNTATVVGAGSVTLTATQSGNSNYHAAEEISQTFCVNPSQPAITSDFLNPEAPVLISSHLVGNQWYLNGDVIPGAVNQSYTVTQAGDYTVQTMTDNCGSDFAEPFTLLITGLDMEAATITLYPNPAKDKLVVKGITAETQVSIVSGIGLNQKVFSEWNRYKNERTIFIENLSGGVYILTLKGQAGTRQIKFSKN